MAIDSTDSGCLWTLEEILIYICYRAGITANYLDFSELNEVIVFGFTMSNAHPAFTYIEALAQIFFFDVSSFDGKIHFISRGMDATDSIETDDLVDDGSALQRTERKDSLVVPRVMHLEYYDIEGGLNPDKQFSTISNSERSSSERKVQTTVILDADQAAQAVVVNHKVAIEEQRGGIDFSLGDNFLRIVPAQVIELNNKRLRINEIVVKDGFQEYKTSFDRMSAYDITNISGREVEGPSDPPNQTIGETSFYFIDSHIIADKDDALGYYVAISAAGDSWSGAFIEYSLDGGANYIDGRTGGSKSIAGELLTTLQVHNQNYPDEINSVTVRLLNENMELESSDLEGMLNRENLAIIISSDSSGIQSELINFANAEQDTNGDWVLDYFLRGRKGSEPFSHEIGEKFVLLERNKMYFIPAELYNLYKEFTFRITSLGSLDQTIETVTFNGLSQTERAPAYLKARRSGSYIIIEWQGVGRLGGGAFVSMGTHFKAYRVKINGAAEPDTTAETITVTDPGGSVTITVQQVNELTGLGPAIQLII